MNIIIIDNYDSFTYNLYHYLEPLADNLDVIRNDQVQTEKIKAYDGIVYSPGPGIPKDSAIMFDILSQFGKEKAILGICLGHQAIIEYFGGKLTNLEHPLHGLSVPVNLTNNNDLLFKNIPKRFQTGRYHSWAAHVSDIPGCIIPTAVDDDQMIMAIKHSQYTIRGMQYHPESVMTPQGKTMLKNWVQCI
jgi:anthranilate synthase component 2